MLCLLPPAIGSKFGDIPRRKGVQSGLTKWRHIRMFLLGALAMSALIFIVSSLMWLLLNWAYHFPT